MPPPPLSETIAVSFGAQEPWPEDVKLYQPYEVEQILLPDNASCLAVQAFLKMCGLSFEVEMRWNAEYMSPSGRVPFLRCGAFVVAELEPIAQFVANKGASLVAKLSSEQKADMRAYMSLINTVLVNAELYVSWLDSETYNKVTRVRTAAVFAWPLGRLQARAKRAKVTRRLKALGWAHKSLDQVLGDVENCCHSLSQRLGDEMYFFGHPTEIDFQLFGHLYSLLTSKQGNYYKIGDIVRHYKVLVRHCEVMARMFFQTELVKKRKDGFICNSVYGRITNAWENQRKNQYAVTECSEQNASDDNSISDGENAECNEGFGNVFEDKEIRSKSNVNMVNRKDKRDNSGERREVSKRNVNYSRKFGDSKVKVEDTTKLSVRSMTGHCDVDDHYYWEGENIPSKSVNSRSTINEEFHDSHSIVAMNKEELDMLEGDGQPTELDALVFGHVFTIITTLLPCARLAEVVGSYPNLVALAKRIDERYFKKSP